MKGIRKYIEKYGKHFTLELAMDVMPGGVKASYIEKVLDEEVWYNLTKSTLGDAYVVVNTAYSFKECEPFNSRKKCIDFAMITMGNPYSKEGDIFDNWVKAQRKDSPNFDFTPYI